MATNEKLARGQGGEDFLAMGVECAVVQAILDVGNW